MSRVQAEAKLKRTLLARLQRTIVVNHGSHHYTLSPEKAKVAVNVVASVDEALKRSRTGNPFQRAVRDLTGGKVDANIVPQITYSHRGRRPPDQAHPPEHQPPVSQRQGIDLGRRAGEGRRAGRPQAPDPPRAHAGPRSADASECRHEHLGLHVPPSAEGQDGGGSEEVQDGADRQPLELHADGLQGLQEGQGVQDRGRHAGARDPGWALPHPEQGREPGLAGPQQPVGRQPRRASTSRRARRTRSRPAGWGSSTGPGSTASTRRSTARSAPPVRTDASA